MIPWIFPCNMTHYMNIYSFKLNSISLAKEFSFGTSILLFEWGNMQSFSFKLWVMKKLGEFMSSKKGLFFALVFFYRISYNFVVFCGFCLRAAKGEIIQFKFSWNLKIHWRNYDTVVECLLLFSKKVVF